MVQLSLDVETGDRAAIKVMLEHLLADSSKGGAAAYSLIGEAYRGLCEYERTFEWWTRAVDRYEIWTLAAMPARIRNHPVIGKDPRFLALLKRMGLEGDGETKAAGQ
jgi:hypothetical protein